MPASLSSTKIGAKSVKQLILLTTNSAMAAAAGYVLTVVLARTLGPTEFGVYSYILIVGSLLTLMIIFATDVTAPMQYARSNDEQRVLCSVYSVKGPLFCVFLAGIVGWSFIAPTLAIGVLAVSVSALNLGFLFEVTNRNVIYSYIFLIERLLYVGSGFMLVLLGWASVNSVFLVLLIATCLSLVWQAHINFHVLRNFRFSIDSVRTAAKSNTFLVVSSLSTFAYGGFSRLVLEDKFGLELLGIYSAGWQLIMAVTIFQAQANRIWRVPLSSDITRNDVAKLRRHVTQYLTFTTLPVIAFALLVLAFNDEIVFMLFGEEYRLLTTIIPVICVYFVIINLDRLAVIFWVAIGRLKEYAFINLTIGLMLLVFLSAQLLPYDLKGFAVMVVFAHALSVMILMVRFYFVYVKPNLLVT